MTESESKKEIKRILAIEKVDYEKFMNAKLSVLANTSMNDCFAEHGDKWADEAVSIIHRVFDTHMED